MIFNMSLGAGSELAFSVAVSRTEPTAPGENMMWIETDSGTQWVFSPVEPAEPVEGLVWIILKNSGDLSFNALKTNGIILHPGSCRQYLSGSWVDKTARIYRNGGWTALTA